MPLVRSLVLALLLLVGLTVTGCGQSEEEQAQQDVCAARDDLRQQVDDLTALTPSTASVEVVQQKLNAIREDLRKIGDARANLSDDRRQQVDDANKAFAEQLDAIVRDLGTNLTVSEAGTKLRAAAQQLATAYEQTFAKVDCA
jgi:type VI protein secretion system component VasK